MTDRSAIGFDRTIRLEWLDVVAAQVSRGATDAEVRAFLWEYLGKADAHTGGEAATRKTITVLRHIWSFVPDDCVSMRDAALEILATCSSAERVAIHWAMTTATYPFFADVTTTVGRLLRLQSTVTSQQVYRRLRELWGDRSTIRRAGQHALSTMKTWGVLEEAGKQGEFEQQARRITLSEPVMVLVFEGLIRYSGAPMVFAELQRHPSLFGFEISLSSGQLRTCAQFDVSRQGIDTDIVALRIGSQGAN